MSKYLFYLSSLFVALPIAAFNFKGFALYYLLFFVILDTKIFSLILNDFFSLIRINNLLLFFLILFIYILLHSFLNLELYEFAVFLIKSFIFIYLVIYFYYCLDQNYSLVGFYIGIGIFISFQLIQFIEFSLNSNTFGLYTNLKNWNFLSTPYGQLLYLQGSTHVNLSKDGLPFFINYFGNLLNIRNVSSFAAEPSIAAYFILPMIFILKNKFLRLLLIFSLFLTFSKSAYFTILFLFIIYFFNNLIKIKINGFYLVFGITFFILSYGFYYFNYKFEEKFDNCMMEQGFYISYDTNQYMQNTNLNQKECYYRLIDESTTNRLLPSILYIENTTVYEKIFGIGFMQSKKAFLRSKWAPNDYMLKSEFKNIYGGFIGILLEAGIFGLVIYSFLIFYFLRFTNYSYASYVLIVYGLSYFYLTLFPFIMFFVAKLIYDKKINEQI